MKTLSTDDVALAKLRSCLEKIIRVLIEHRNNIEVHSNIDQFFYMQKCDELQILFENVVNAQQKLETATTRFEKQYQELFSILQRDTKFLSEVLHVK